MVKEAGARFLVVTFALAVGGLPVLTQPRLAPQGPDTLATALKAAGIATDGLPASELQRRITSYSTLSEAGEVAAAYCEDRGDGLIHAPLRIVYRPASGPWQLASHGSTGGSDRFGGVTRLTRAGGLLAVTVHLSPSASDTLLIRKADLSRVRRLEGWPVQILPSGVIVFQRSMVHFAPAHPGELAVYDPAADLQSALFPLPDDPRRTDFIERQRSAFSSVPTADRPSDWDPTWFDVSYDLIAYDSATDTLRFRVAFQARRDQLGIWQKTQRRFRMACRDMSLGTRRCVEDS